MSQTLQLPNFTENNLIYNNQSQLTAAPSPNPGSSALAVDNAVGYTTGYLLLGVAGSSIAELLPNTSVNSGVSIALVSPTV
jgi:hypothetical protein